MSMTLDKMGALVAPGPRGTLAVSADGQRGVGRIERRWQAINVASQAEQGTAGRVVVRISMGGFITTRKMNVGGVAHAQAEWAATKAYHKEISLAVSPGHCRR
jgi:hypothetical protein